MQCRSVGPLLEVAAELYLGILDKYLRYQLIVRIIAVAWLSSVGQGPTSAPDFVETQLTSMAEFGST